MDDPVLRGFGIRDPAVYARSSPITFIRQVRTPTSAMSVPLYRVPSAADEEFGHAMKALGIPSATVIYPGEGHAIHDPEHLADLDKRTLEWLDRYLK